MLTIVLTLAAAITLIVSGVGIMNSMLANVQARIREIGIRKASAPPAKRSASSSSPRPSSSRSPAASSAPPRPRHPPLRRPPHPYQIPVSGWSAVIALTTSVLVGVIFGTLPPIAPPAWTPSETLKYE